MHLEFVLLYLHAEALLVQRQRARKPGHATAHDDRLALGRCEARARIPGKSFRWSASTAQGVPNMPSAFERASCLLFCFYFSSSDPNVYSTSVGALGSASNVSGNVQDVLEGLEEVRFDG